MLYYYGRNKKLYDHANNHKKRLAICRKYVYNTVRYIIPFILLLVYEEVILVKLFGFKKVFSAAVSALMITSSIPFTAYSADKQLRGNIGGYDYEMWNQDSVGDIEFEADAGSFTCSWRNIQNFIVSMGKIYNNPIKTYKELENVSFSYDLDLNSKGNTYFGAYGWTRNPLVEYYIIDGWGDWRPPGYSDTRKYGTAVVNKNEYDVYSRYRYNQPSIEGTKTFLQYWSVRKESASANNQNNNIKGRIDVAKHFASWEKLGLDTSGTLYETFFYIEGYHSDGNAELKSLIMGNGKDSTPVEVYGLGQQKDPPLTPDTDGYYIKNEFSDDTENWEPFEKESLNISSVGYNNTNGMLVHSDYAPWAGAKLKIGSGTLIPGKTYSIGTMVMQDSVSSSDFSLRLEYIDPDGKYQYITIAETSGRKGEWTKLSNAFFTLDIPEGSTDMSVIISSVDKVFDFYVDNAYVGEEGAPSFVPSPYDSDEHIIGEINGYRCEFWNKNKQGKAEMQPGDHSFTCSWSGIDNFIARMGKHFSKEKNYKAYGDIVLYYDVDYSPNGNSYLSVYGWTQSPLAEYYIVEGWGSWAPPGNGGEKKGSVSLNGNRYDLYKVTRYNQPTIYGSSTFQQYWSVRQTSGSKDGTTNHMKGSVDVSKHFQAWENTGLDMSGSLYDVTLSIEGFQSDGYADVKKIDIVYTEKNPDPIIPEVNYFKSDFESDNDDWYSRGTAAVSLDPYNYYSGKNSLKVSERSDCQHGFVRALDPSIFKPGKTYSFSTGVLQKSGKPVKIQLALQQGEGENMSYTNIATVKAESGVWTKLENTEFTIPEGSDELYLCVSTTEDDYELCDFYIDSANGSSQGTKSTVITGLGKISEDLPKETVIGDINGDGALNIADMLLLKKWLLGSYNLELKNWKAADLNNDDKLDIFDLCQIRDALIKNTGIPVSVSIRETGGYMGVNRLWKIYKDNGKFILYYDTPDDYIDTEPIITEITEEEYREILIQNYERNTPPAPVMDGFYYKTVITYSDGTEKTTNSDMYDVVLKIKKLFEQYHDTILI